MRYLLIILLLAGCGNKSSTSSGGRGSPSESHAMLTGKLLSAYNLVKDYYDFTTVYIALGDAHGNWGEYNAGFRTIVVSEGQLSRHDDKYNSCGLVHELAHHNGKDQDGAFAEQAECLKII